jgi:osmoprotectant transport system substrate-binding protein
MATRWRAGRLAALLALAVLAGSCGGADQREEGAGQPQPTKLTVGSLEVPESQIVSQMYKQVLEDIGYQADWVFDFSTQEELLAALEAGEIDVAPFYLSSLAAELDPEIGSSGDAAAIAGALDPVLGERDLTLLAPARADSGPALVVPPETAEELGLASVGDLARVAGDLTLAAPPACEQDPACLPGLRETYGIEFGGFEATADPARALDRGAVDVALVPATSADVRRERWVVLEDEQGIQPAENLTPVARTDSINDEIAGILNAVSSSLDAGELTVYNGALDLGEAPGVVATLHLNNERLLGLEEVATGPAEAPLGTEPPESCLDATGTPAATVIADELAFDAACLTVSADQSIEFVNADEAYPHTFTVSRDRTYTPPFLIDLDDGQGGQTITSDPVGQALEPGGWPFVCRYHEFMAGEIYVVG